ncbi:hypothetical protein NQZ68_039100 [Dissostichus eleginoides]|nr:hypothetical protein NQZ68_039100 [Dissostichus eleginoides]
MEGNMWIFATLGLIICWMMPVDSMAGSETAISRGRREAGIQLSQEKSFYSLDLPVDYLGRPCAPGHYVLHESPATKKFSSPVEVEERLYKPGH